MQSLVWGRNGEYVVEFAGELPMALEDIPSWEVDVWDDCWNNLKSGLFLRENIGGTSRHYQNSTATPETLDLTDRRNAYGLELADVGSRLAGGDWTAGDNKVDCLFCPAGNKRAISVYATRAMCYHDGGSCPVAMSGRGSRGTFRAAEIVGWAMRLPFPTPAEAAAAEHDGFPCAVDALD